MEPETQSWRTEPRRVYSNDFKLRLVELAIPGVPASERRVRKDIQLTVLHDKYSF